MRAEVRGNILQTARAAPYLLLRPGAADWRVRDGVPSLTRPLRTYANVCHGKTPYSTKGEARQVMRFMRRTVSLRLQVYLCPFCGRYHFGNKKRRRQ